VDTSGLSSGDYSCDVFVGSNGGDANFTVMLEVVDVDKTIDIVGLETGFVYLQGSKLMNLRFLQSALVFGEVILSYETQGFNPSYVEFVLEDVVVNSSSTSCGEFIYSNRGFGRSLFKVVAYNDLDEEICIDEISVFNINFRGG